MKSKRQDRIRELITEYNIETQDEMMNRLREEGFAVTQATVSRDLREMKLTKILAENGRYKYSLTPERHHITRNAKLNDAMVSSITHVAYSMNNVVVKTYPGMAQAVASGIDAMNMENILGCVAGDDTIIIVTDDQNGAQTVNDRIAQMMSTRAVSDKG